MPSGSWKSEPTDRSGSVPRTALQRPRRGSWRLVGGFGGRAGKVQLGKRSVMKVHPFREAHFGVKKEPSQTLSPSDDIPKNHGIRAKHADRLTATPSPHLRARARLPHVVVRSRCSLRPQKL